MPFTNPVFAGGTLVRDSIESPNFVTGVSGWAIRRDGTAEFSDTTVRGDLIVNGTDGSYLWLHDAPGGSVVMELRPADDATYGTVTEPSSMVAGADPNTGTPGILFSGPSYAGALQPYFFMGRSPSGLAQSMAVLDGDNTVTVRATNNATVAAPTINLNGSVNATSLTEGGNAVVTAPSGFSGLIKWNDVTVTTNASGIGTVTHGAGFTPSGVVICQIGVSGSSGVNVFVLSGTYTGTTFQFKATTSAGVYAGSIGISFICLA